MEAGVRVWSQSLWRILARGAYDVDFVNLEAHTTRVSVSERWLIGVARLLFLFAAQLCPRHRACHRVETTECKGESLMAKCRVPGSLSFLLFFFLTLSFLIFVYLSRTCGTMHPVSSATNDDNNLHPYSTEPAAFQLFPVMSPIAWPIASQDPLLLRLISR